MLGVPWHESNHWSSHFLMDNQLLSRFHCQSAGLETCLCGTIYKFS